MLLTVCQVLLRDAAHQWIFCVTNKVTLWSIRSIIRGHVRGLGSVSSAQMDSNTLEMVSAGLHWSLRTSRHICP